MTDPDAPSPSEPSLREWVHWIVTDIPGDGNPIQAFFGRVQRIVILCSYGDVDTSVSPVSFFGSPYGNMAINNNHIRLLPNKILFMASFQRIYKYMQIIFDGNEILPYDSLSPRLGIHRFILLLFEQKGPLGLVEQPLSRANFSTRAFARDLDLGMPVSTVYFNAQKERPTRKR